MRLVEIAMRAVAVDMFGHFVVVTVLVRDSKMLDHLFGVHIDETDCVAAKIGQTNH